DFVRGVGWGDADERLLAGGPSFRRLFRPQRGAERAVGMVAPPADENVRPFQPIPRHLPALGPRGPGILGSDRTDGLLPAEGVGDDTFTRVLAAGGDEACLYRRATDVLVALYDAGDRALLPGLDVYLGETLIDAAMLLAEWYLPAAAGRPATDEEMADYRSAWRACLANLPEMPSTLMLRDYHRDNLVWLPARPGVKACGLLDFQDAQEGHCAYDLASLL